MPNYKLTKYKKGQLTPQFCFYQSRAKIQAFGGAYANGKTTALVMKCLNVAKDYPGAECLLARATYPKLNDTVRKVFMKWCPPHWIKRRPTQDDNTCYLVNGSSVMFRYISQKGKNREDGTSTSNLLSATYDFIGVDQIEDPEIAHKDFLDLLGRLRGHAIYRPGVGEEDPTMPDSGPRWFCWTANPAHNWLYREIVHPWHLWKNKGIYTEKLLIDSKTHMPIMDLFEGDIYSNEDNLDEDYIRTQEAAYKGQMRDRYLLGKWAAFEGLVHPGYDHDRHVMTRGQMIDHLLDCLERHVDVKVIEGYDFGIAANSCYMFGFIDDYGRVFILDGFYRREYNLYDQPDGIREIREKYDNMIKATEKINGDPAIFRRQVIAKQKNTGDTIARILSDNQIAVRPSSNDVLAGIAKVNGYLSGHIKIPHAVTLEKPGPLIYFCADLTWIEDEISSYYWKKNPQGMNLDEPLDGNDDAMNTLKYLLARQPQPADIVIPENILPPGYMFWQEEGEAVEREF